jgi:hypothetical protein
MAHFDLTYDPYPILHLAGVPYPPDPTGVYKIPAVKLFRAGAKFSDLPQSPSWLCIRLRDLSGSGHLAECTFERSSEGVFYAHISASFVPNPEEFSYADACIETREALARSAAALAAYDAAGILVRYPETRHSDSYPYPCDRAYITFVVRIGSQSFADAVTYARQLATRLYVGIERPERSWLFVSYASEDFEFVGHLLRELDARALCAWFDKREILVGESIVERINEALSQTRFLLVVFSPRSAQKPWVLRELNSSLMGQLGKEGITILPVLYETCSLPALLRDIKYADFRTSFSDGMAELLAAIHGRQDSR